MSQYLLFTTVIAIVTFASDVRSHDKLEGLLDDRLTDNQDLTTDIEINSDIKKVVQKIEDISANEKKSSQEGIVLQEDVEKLHAQIAERLDELIIALANTHNAHTFLNIKGIKRVISPNINTNYPQVKGRILAIINTLFDVVPNTTNTLMPKSLVDKMIDVFENDNLDFKEISLDILYHWLPNNPKLQARVMKLKGLEAFYQQMSKLDMKVSLKLLNLFNKILQEHIAARELSKNIEVDNNVKLYQMMGLIERMSTPYICNGFLNVIEMITSKENSLQIPIIELIKNLKSFCFEVYRGKTKAINLFDNFYNILSNEKANSLDESRLNITKIKEDIQEYLNKLKVNVRNEF